MTMSALLTLASDHLKTNEARAAREAGWPRAHLWWERLQETGCASVAAGRARAAIPAFVAACILGGIVFRRADPRYATSLANLAYVCRALGLGSTGRKLYKRAVACWPVPETALEDLTIRPRARSSLFHLRMEAKHRETYRANMKIRLGKFMAEAREILHAHANGESPPHRSYSRWRGERPAIFDDTRAVLSACLLIAEPTA